MATVRDISERTGYSQATISRILSNDSTFVVTAETRQRVLDCAKELNYVYKGRHKVPENNSMQKHKIGIVPIGLESTERGELQDPYYLYIRNGIEERLDQLGFHNTVIISMSKKQDYEKLEGVESIIVIGKKEFDTENPFFRRLLHVIFVDYDFDHHRYDCVLSDFSDAVRTAVDFMAECGYRKVGYIGSWDYINDFANNRMIQKLDSRQITFEAYAEEKGLSYKPYLYVGEKFTKGVGYDLAKSAICSGKLPEAFLVGSDPMAMGVYRAFGEAGIRIGTDIGLISIDNIADTAYMTPPLTSVMVYAQQMGRSAVDCLVQRLEGRKVPVKMILPTALVERESCKRMLPKAADRSKI